MIYSILIATNLIGICYADKFTLSSNDPAETPVSLILKTAQSLNQQIPAPTTLLQMNSVSAAAKGPKLSNTSKENFLNQTLLTIPPCFQNDIASIIDVITTAAVGETMAKIVQYSSVSGIIDENVLICAAKNNGPDLYDAACVSSESSANAVQLYGPWQDCCTCGVGGCSSIFHADCHGCQGPPRGPTLQEEATMEGYLGTQIYPKIVTWSNSPNSEKLVHQNYDINDLKQIIIDDLTSEEMKQALFYRPNKINIYNMTSTGKFMTQMETAILGGVLTKDFDTVFDDFYDDVDNASRDELELLKLAMDNSSSSGFGRSCNSTNKNGECDFFGLYVKKNQDNSLEMALCNGKANLNMSKNITAEDVNELYYQLKSFCIMELLSKFTNVTNFYYNYYDYLLYQDSEFTQKLSSSNDWTRKIENSIANSISGALASSSQSVQFIKVGTEFTRFQSSTESAVLHNVVKSDAPDAIEAWAKSSVTNISNQTIDQMKLLLYGSKEKESLLNHIVHYNQTTGGEANTMIYYMWFNNDTTINMALCTVGANFQVEGDLEIITTTKGYFGNTISGGSSIDVKRLPPTWNINDTYALNNYMITMCQSDLAQQEGKPIYPPMSIH
jgi:hypothetical protein